MARIRTGDIRVQGLREVNAALRAIGPDARTELKEASRNAAELVARDATSAALGIGSTAAHVAPSITARASVSGNAAVAFGGAAWPMAGGAEFGSIKYRQFQPWRGNGSGAGYFIFPTIRDDSEEIVEEYAKALDHIIQRRFPQ